MNLNEALNQLKAAGYKYTNKRAMILEFFANEGRYRTAKELLSYMEPHYDGISFDTIYRNLHLFNELGILESTELDGEKHYQIRCANHHHHHFICRNCGATKRIQVCPMDFIDDDLSGYMIEGHKFEVYGLCPACQAA